jgi:hypothetical protein
MRAEIAEQRTGKDWAEQIKRLRDKLKIQYTPKHGSYAKCPLKFFVKYKMLTRKFEHVILSEKVEKHERN